MKGRITRRSDRGSSAGHRHDPRGPATSRDPDPATRAPVKTLRIECTRQPVEVAVSARTSEIRHRFGVHEAPQRTILPAIDVDLGPGRLVAFVGPSGSGKSSALAVIAQRTGNARNVNRVSFAPDRAIVDGVAPGSSMARALEVLSFCALGEAGIWIKPFAGLSDGERFRAKLARAIGAVLDQSSSGPLIIDEFASGLHRRAARAIAYNLRKLTSRWRISVAVATTHDDVLSDLRPDTVVRLDRWADPVVVRRSPRTGTCSLWRRMRVMPASRRDYGTFAGMHYRGTHELGFVDKVFALRDGAQGQAVGIVVYSHAAR